MAAECLCGHAGLEQVAAFDAPPPGETRFDFGHAYARRLLRCRACGHVLSDHAMDLEGLYAGAYVDSTYGDRLRAVFERICALPPEASDNHGRVVRVAELARRRFAGRQPGHAPRVLDVGSGLCVFLHRLKDLGFDCLALDPDRRAADHARQVAGVASVQADFRRAAELGLGAFDVITFNKVLEHVADPVAMLAAAGPLLEQGGMVYLELPDGEAALQEGPHREEFFIEHHHAFSPESVARLARLAGFAVLECRRLREPSGKYTVWAALEAA